jgi:hypothetical protein
VNDVTQRLIEGLVVGSPEFREGIKNDRPWRCAVVRLNVGGKIWICRAWNHQCDDIQRYGIDDGYELTACVRDGKKEGELEIRSLVIKERARYDKTYVEPGTIRADGKVFVQWVNGAGKIIGEWKPQSECVQDSKGKWWERIEFICSVLGEEEFNREIKSLCPSLLMSDAIRHPKYGDKVKELLEAARFFEANPVRHEHISSQNG